MRTFDTGATRDSDVEKYDYEGFLHPLVLERFGAYMHRHRQLPDGSLRASDNWQAGIPRHVYIKSALRHFMSWWAHHREAPLESSTDDLEEALCGVLFNTMGYLYETLREKRQASSTGAQA